MKTFRLIMDRSVDWLEPRVGTPISAGIMATTLALLVFAIPAIWNGWVWWLLASFGTGVGNAVGLFLAMRIWK